LIPGAAATPTPARVCWQFHIARTITRHTPGPLVLPIYFLKTGCCKTSE
jgi:hypothetical protein